MMPATLEVRPRWADLMNGTAWNPNDCALAVYMKRTYPQYTQISVNDDLIKLFDPEERRRWQWGTPLSVKSWLIEYDQFVTRGCLGPVPGLLEFSLRRGEALSQLSPERTPAARQQARLSAVKQKARLDAMSDTEKAARLRKNEKQMRKRRRGL